ncbi:hypothetical protein Taro_030304 [Colocasia esculenta]|uniref:Uncharacterized protein n=1 Tax=Colocasia esculenta TaxID=4460 RepID=A0A843W2Y2_COLES|nr:hypothetical protein [Colocasia esculenta]
MIGDGTCSLPQAIEYVQFLQEKVLKYESSYPGWNHDNTKLIPWKLSQTPGECMVNSSHITKNGPTSTGFRFPAESTIPGVPTVVSNTQVVAESDNVCSGLASKSASVSFPMPSPIGVGSEISQLQQRMISDSENMARHEAQWLRPCAMESSVSSDILSGEEELAIEKGSISLSSKYSEGLLTTLTQALRTSGVDLSQASISVQINLGKHAINRPISNTKAHRAHHGLAQPITSLLVGVVFSRSATRPQEQLNDSEHLKDPEVVSGHLSFCSVQALDYWTGLARGVP